MRLGRTFCITIWPTLALLSSTALRAQTGRVEIPDVSPNVGLTVTVSTVATLGQGDGPGSLEGIPLDVTVDSRNRYWVSGTSRPPMIYDALGRFLASAGREGQGPGEFLGPSLARFIDKDSVLVIDQRQGRATVLTSDLRFVRTFSLFAFRQHTLVGRTLVGSGLLRTPEGAGLPLHLLSIGPASSVFKSVSPDSTDLRVTDERLFVWRLASGRRNTFWSADVAQYRIVQWSSDGVPLRQLVRKPTWFPGISLATPGGTRTPPHPSMQAVSEDSTGLVWVAALVASANWREGWEGAFRGGTRGDASRVEAGGGLDITKLYRTNLEVLDPTAGKVVATFSVNEIVVSLLPQRRAAVYVEDAAGRPRIEIRKFTISNR